MPDYAVQRANMVACQILTSDVTDPGLLAAFGAVPRERFVPTNKHAIAYSDMQIEVVNGRWLLDPRTFAKLLDLAEIRPTDTVLDVGCATGYSTAVLSRVAGVVVGLEQDADLVRIAADTLPTAAGRNARVVQGSFAEGHRAMAPYDAVVIEGGIEVRPHVLLAQLADGGRLVAVVQRGTQGHAVLYLNEQGRIGRRTAFDASVPLLGGFRQPVGFVF